MRSFIVLCTILVSSVLATAQEVQVAFDRTGKIFVITRTVNDQHKIITGFDDFVEARLFMLADSSYSLEVVTESFGLRARTARPLTQINVDSIRDHVDAVLASVDEDEIDQDEVAPRIERNQEGRSALLWGSTLWSLFYYGTATAVALDINEPAVPMLLAGGLGYFVPALLTANATVTDGAASLALGGMFQGWLHGFSLALLLTGESVIEDDQPRMALGLSVLTGVTETIAGYVVATNTGMKEGRAGVINSTAFFGLYTGGLFAATVIDMTDGSDDVSARLAGGTSLLGAAAGVVIGNAIANGQHYTSGDASMYLISGLFGAGLPWVVLAATEPDQFSTSLMGPIGIATTIGGLWLGDLLVRGKDYRASDGGLSFLSLLGGGLIGLGAGIAIDEPAYTPALMYGGALGGFALSLVMANPKGESKATSSLEINVNPMGPLMLQRDAYGITRPAPFAIARYRF